MTSTAGYAFICFLLVGAVTLGLWPFLSPPARTGVLVAALVAYPVQVLAFGLLVRLRHHGKGFAVAWGGGTLVRFGVIGAVAVLVVRRPSLPPVPTLLALAGFLFGMLLLEPLFFRKAAPADHESSAT